MKLICLLLLLFVVSSPVHAGDLILMGVSRHTYNNDEYNNLNYGLVIKQDGWLIGGFKNSLGEPAGIIAKQVYRFDRNWSVIGGALLGYKFSPVIPGVGLVYEYKRFNLLLTPYVSTATIDIVRW